jgi:outer membrane protein TolC
MSSSFVAPIHERTAVLLLQKRVALVFLLGTFSFSTIAFSAPLTLEQAQRLAVERSRKLSAQDHAVMASRDMAVAASRLPDPILRAGIENLPVNGSDRFSLTSDFMTMRRVGVMQEFTRADKRKSRADRYEREAEKLLAEKSMAIAAIQRDTALAWLDRYYVEAMAAVIAEQGEQARLEIQAAEGAYRAGRGSQAELVGARSALAAFDDRTSEVQRRVRNAKTMLARWTGIGTDVPLTGKPATETIRVDPAALDKQLAHHPQIAVLDKQEQITAAEARMAQADRQSDWSVEVAYQQRGPAYSNMISIGVSIPLQWDQKNRQDRELSARLAMVEQAKAERDEALRTHVAEVSTMIDEWQNGRERQARYERELIPLANDRTLAAIAAYRGGKSSLADVLAARRNEIDVRIQALQLQTDTARLWAQLNFLFPAADLAPHSSTTMIRDTK